MKQLLLWLICLSLLFACNNSNTPPKSNDDTSGQGSKTDTMPRVSFTKADLDRIVKEVDQSVAIEMIYHYKKNRANILEPQIGKQDTRFQTHKITELIAYLTHANSKLGADGIRLYFGVYPPGGTEDKNNMQAIVMIPTKDGKDIIVNETVLMQAFNEGQMCPPPRPCASAGAILMNEADRPGYRPRQ